jgi:hypothetical protein
MRNRMASAAAARTAFPGTRPLLLACPAITPTVAVFISHL